ncbi:hypothetical protein IEQ34_020415 [Dendrobium chrysotoxum]|uniref:Uncharacterized protein n=1 Tax=Dendrobium chrysotoxum TaxID=161865 RepID=A0AAV7G1X7_DENCH|nr:hypothetical protein IEQ34_020415 [Dendrobium chrysotoxum]
MYARSAIRMNNYQSDLQSRENRKGRLQRMVNSSSFRATLFRVAAEDGCLFHCLIELVLINCPKLKESPSLPLKLKGLKIISIGWKTLNCCSISNSISLEFFVVYYYPNITSLLLADEIARLGALRYLTIKRCPNLISLGRHREMETTNKLLSHAK